MELKPFNGTLDATPDLIPFSGKLDGEVAPKRGIAEDIATHLAVGANKYLALPVAGITEMAGKATGIKPLENAGKAFGDNAESWIAQKEHEDPSQKFRDISSVGDAARWAGEQMLEFAPQVGVGILTGGAGAAAGRVAAGGLARAGITSIEGMAGKKAVQAAVTNTGRDLTAKELGILAADRAGTAGAIAATGAGSVAMESSTIYRDQKPEEKDMGRALLYGTAAGILDTAFPAYLMKKTGLTKIMPGMSKVSGEADALTGKTALTGVQRVKDTVKVAGLGIGEETIQEGVQTVLENIGANKQVYSDEVNKAGGNFSAFLKVAAEKGISAAVHPEAWNDIIESMAAGGLIGGVMGGGSSAAGHISDVMQQRGQQQQTPTEEANALNQQNQPATEIVSGANARTGNILQDSSSIASDSIPESWPVDSGRDLGIAATPPAGAMTRAVNSILPDLPPISADMYSSFAAQPFANAPEAQPDTAVLPSPPNELERALAWRKQQTSGHLMQLHGERDASYSSRILSEYRKSQEKANGITSILPEVQGAGPSKVDGQGVAVSKLQGQVAGVGSDNIQPGGVSNDLSSVQQEINGTQKEVSGVRNQTVADRVTALKQEKDQLLTNNSSKGITGGLVYPAEVTQRLGEINAEIQAAESGKAATPPKMAEQVAEQTRYTVPDPKRPQAVPFFDFKIGKAADGKYYANAGYNIAHSGYGGPHPPLTPSGHTKGHNTEREALLAAVSEVRSKVVSATNPQGEKYDTSKYIKELDKFLGGLPPENKTGKTVQPEKPANTRRQLDTTKDSLAVAVAKLGGVSRTEIDKQSGNGKDLAHTLNSMATKEAKAGILHVISSKGIPLDRMRESLVEQGYLDESADINTLLDKLDSASRGTVHRSTHSTEAGADAYREAEIRYSEMINAMTDEEYDDFSRNQWLDEQVQELADAGDILTEYIDGLDNETMTAADWQEVENDLKEALDATEFSQGNSTEDQGQVQEDATSKAEGFPPVGKGDVASEGTAGASKTVERLPLPGKKEHPRGKAGQKAYEAMLNKYDLWDAPSWDRNDFDKMFYANYHAGWQDHGQPMLDQTQHTETANEAYAAGLVDGVKVEKPQKAAKTSAPRTARIKNLQTKLDNGTLLTQQRDELNKLTAIENPPPATTVDVPAGFGDKNALFTKEKADKARAILRAKLNQLNAGLDPEMITAGIDIAGYYIEGGFRSFKEYSGKMVEDLGEAITPFLKSFYLAVRNYPGFDNKGMNSEADIDELQKVEQVEKAITPKILSKHGNKKMRGDYGVTDINGYSATGEKAKSAFLSDAKSYLKEVSQVLKDNGYSPEKINSNPGGTAGSGDVSLLAFKEGSDIGVYVTIGAGTSLPMVSQSSSGIQIMYRATTRKNKYQGLVNRWDAGWDSTTGALAEKMLVEAQKHETLTTAIKPPSIGEAIISMGSKAQSTGEPRVTPSDFNSEEKKLWYEGWDAAKDKNKKISAKSGIIKPEDQGGGVTNDTTRNGSTSTATLESNQPGSLSGNGDEQGTGSLLGSSSTVDATGNGHPDERGSDRSGSVASKPRPVHNQDGGTTEGGLQPVIPTPASEPRGLFRSGINPGNYRITADTHLGEGTRGQKIDNNLAAIRLIKTLDSENRYPTIEEQHVLARYVGWGGLKSVFDPTSKQPQDQKARLELEKLMSKEEYFEARQSVLNAHYTSSDVISSIYKVLDHFGFSGGNVMEPTYGSGNFIGLMPGKQAASSKWYGSELDLVTAKIGQYLYPDAQLLQSGFQDAEFPYGKFDLVIGNPPFGGERITDTNKKRSDISGFKIHNYIIAKSAMHLRPGGVMAMVVTSRFMDTADSEARDYLAKQFKFLSAIRLPNDAFAKNAGTEVTTDMVFFQKLMPGENADEQYKGWLKTDVTMTNAAGEEVTVNNWFAKRPEMMLGEPSMKGTMYGGQWRKEDGKGEFTLDARPGQDTVAELEKVIAGDLLAKHKDIFKPTTAKSNAAATSIQMNREDIGVGGYFEENDKLFMREDDDEQGNPTFIELTADTQWTEKQSLGETRLNRIKGMMNLRKLAYSLIEAERFDLSDIETQRRALNKAYDAFVEKFGYISETANSSLMAEDVKIESGLESSFKPAITAARAKVLGGKPKKAHAVKASLLKERVYYPQKDIVTAENARDGYNISLSEKGKLDLLYIAGLTKDTVEGVTEKLANEGLIFRDPETGEWIQEDSYLSGNVKAKLARVDGRDGYEKNIEALKRVLPVDVPTERIFVDLGATWVPESVYKAFADYLGISNARVMVLPETGSVKIVSSGTVTTNDVNVLMQNEDFGIAELFNAIANKQSVVAYDPPADRNSSRTVNKERTKALGPIVKRMSATFKDWVMADPMQASLLTKEYNDTQNTHAPRNFNGKYLKTVGASPAVRLRNSQRNAAWRMIQSPVTLLDHVVGAGKTFTVITGIMERKRLWLSNKPMVVVPNHLVGQWAADFLKLYPGANILAATPKDFAAKNRRRLFARIATGNFDAVIVGHSSFGFIPMEPGTQREILMEEISYLERALHQADTAGDKRTVRNIAERIAKKKEKISDLLSRPTDNVITFENMGIDNLTVDESHEFKNLEYSTSMQNITGMGNPKGAKKSFDLYAKIQYLRSKDGAVTFATGTPISNSLVEMYAVLRYLNRPGLKDRKLDVFDSWAKTYALIQPTIEYTASQKLKERQIMNTFDNLTSMLQLYSEFADIISMQDLKRIYAEQIRELNKESGSKESEAFPIPVVKDGGRRLDVGEPTEAQQAYTEYLIARADRLEKLGGKNDPKEDNHLWLMSDARKMALDIRLVDPSAPSDPANKINRSATEIMRIYRDTNSDKGTQLVFCDLSTPAKGAGKEADKFINGALKVLGLDKDKRFMALLSDIPYREKWNMISMKLDVEVLQLNESADTDANAARREKLEEFREKIGDEELSVLLTADSGFSVYDELKRTLIEKGIKENEIAFIHDANTQPQKDELFARVNSGDLRVLIGSSKKMGAGMNAQERLVALHHLDAPWRPSDVEQREGRIIRQGNSLYMVNPDGFQVEIIAYSTSRTFDAVMWQILSRKAGMLDDFRSGADSLTEEATDSAGYAEFMAETTGNPIFKEKFNLEKQIDEAESTHRSILARRKASERIVKNAADLLRQDQRDVDSTKRDLDELKDAASFAVNGEEYADDLTDAYNAALVKFKEDFQQYENVLFPEYQSAVADLDAKLADGRIDDAQYKELKPKKPAAPAKPGLVRLEKTSQAASAALRISEMLDEIGDRGDVEFSYGAAQIVIAKNTNSVSGGKAGTIDVNYDFEIFINGEQQRELRVTGLKHMSEARLMSLFSTGAIKATIAMAHSNAKYRMERTAKDIATAELTLDKLKMPDVSKLEQMRERYKQITEQVNNLEKDMADKRAQGDNQYIARDRSRFGAGIVSQPPENANFALGDMHTDYPYIGRESIEPIKNIDHTALVPQYIAQVSGLMKDSGYKVKAIAGKHGLTEMQVFDKTGKHILTATRTFYKDWVSLGEIRGKILLNNGEYTSEGAASKFYDAESRFLKDHAYTIKSLLVHDATVHLFNKHYTAKGKTVRFADYVTLYLPESRNVIIYNSADKAVMDSLNSEAATRIKESDNEISDYTDEQLWAIDNYSPVTIKIDTRISRSDASGNQAQYAQSDSGLREKTRNKSSLIFSHVQTFVDSLPIAKRVKVWQSPEDLKTSDPTAYNQIEIAKVDPARVQAMEFNGIIHVIVENIPDMQRVKALVIGHELAHAGQTKKVVDLAVDWFKRTVNGKTEAAKEAHLMLERIAGRYGYDLTDEKQYRRAVQEATAAIAEQAVNADWKPAGLMQRLFMYIKHWLRQQGLISHVSDSELSLAVAEMLRIGEKRLSVGLGGNEAQFAAAWHGSPHDHNGFSTAHIGTGEGNQAYGYGLYFAGSKDVAEYYRDSLSRGAGLSVDQLEKYFQPGRIVPSYGGQDKVVSFNRGDDRHMWSVTVHHINKDGNRPIGPDGRNRTHFTMPSTQDYERMTGDKIGKLYNVELAPKEDEYLLWDKPLGEQSDKVKASLKEAFDDIVNRETDYHKASELSRYYQEMIDKEDKASGAYIYKNIAMDMGDQAASEYLHSLGIRGIKYLDGSSRNNSYKVSRIWENENKPNAPQWRTSSLNGYNEVFKTEGEAVLDAENRNTERENHNYVIFNDADVTIQAKFSLQDQAISQHAAKINAPAKVTDMVKSLIEMAGQSIPERLKANIGKILSNPWFGSEGKPIRRHVVNLNLERSQNRNGIISDLFQASEGYTGVEGLDNILKKASKEELKQFNDLIKHGDENGVATYFTRDELYRGKTKFGKVGKTVVEAYRAFHEVMNAANRVRFQQLDELSMLPYKDQEWFADLVELLNKNMERAAGLDAKEASEVHRLIRSLKRNLTDEELSSGENPAKIKASPAVIAAYRDFWKQVDQTEKKHQGNMLSAFRDILGYRGELDKLKSEWGNLRGYAPRNRKDGDWHVSVYTTNEEGERVKVYMKPTLTETGAKSLVREVQADLKKHLKGNFEAGTKYEVEYERNNATPSELLAWKGSEVAVEALLNQAFDRAGVTGKMSVEQWQSLKHEVFQEIAKEIMAQGFGRHGISREANMIEGYDDTDYQTVLKEYISGMSGWLSKMRFAIETTSAAKDISKANPSDKVWVNDYVQDAMKNSTYLDELAATARSVGAVYYLGFKVSSALLNAFQNYTVGQAELSLMMKKAGHKGSGIAALAKAQKDVMADFVNIKSGGTGTLTKEEHDVLFRAVREGTAQAQAIRQISGTQEMGFGTGWKKFTELSMTPFQFVEQRLNREPAILAAYRIFKKSAAGTIDEAAYKQAETFVNNTHYVMGKENLPEMVRKLGPLGKTAYLFQGYVHNYMHWMFNRAKDGEFATIARSLGAIAALGGVFALPGADDMDSWIMKWFGVSYKMKFKKFVKDAAGNSTPGQIVQNFVNHGVTSVAGVDMSRALAVNIPFISDPEKTFGERIGGAWGGLLKKPGMAVTALHKGSWYRFAENLLPEFAANPMRAARQYNQGATTLGGKPIFDETGRQVKYSGTDVAKKMLGFNPMDISDRTNLKSDERDLNAYWKSERDDALAGIRRAKNPEDMKTAVRGVIKYNTELRKSQAFGLVPIIKAESIQKSRTFKPQKKTMAWERNQIE